MTGPVRSANGQRGMNKKRLEAAPPNGHHLQHTQVSTRRESGSNLAPALLETLTEGGEYCITW